MPKRISKKDRKLGQHFIREWREFRGLSLDGLANILGERLEGVSKSTLSRVETGQQPYGQALLEALAWALQCNESDLLERDPNDSATPLFDKVKRIPPERRPQVAEILETFTKP